jgi:L-ascorbate metabolism protein UlaG (beta-lactamase superfamily)
VTASITYVGHATVLVELDGVRILTDPLLRAGVAHLRRIGPPPGDLGPLDAVLISHGHFDHLDLGSLRRLRSVPTICPHGLGRFLRRRIPDVTELDPGEEAAVGPVTVRATPAAHGGGRPPLHPLGRSVGFLLSGSASVYFAGDTDLFDELEGLADDLDVALLPVAGWGAKVGPGHLDSERAAEAVRRLRPRLAIPIHWGTFERVHRRTRDPAALRAPAEEFARRVGEVAPGVVVRILAPGERLELSAR